MDQASLWLSVAALGVSALSFYFAVQSWRESNRPLVTARVSTHSAGNMAVTLNLVVENTGTRPARNIRLFADERLLDDAMLDTVSDEQRTHFRACFSAKFMIPVLANGAQVTNAFGVVNSRTDSTWKLHQRVPIRLAYQDLDGRDFLHELDLFIADDSGFAASAWNEA